VRDSSNDKNLGKGSSDGFIQNGQILYLPIFPQIFFSLDRRNIGCPLNFSQTPAKK